jgi:hypothetical protein
MTAQPAGRRRPGRRPAVWSATLAALIVVLAAATVVLVVLVGRDLLSNAVQPLVFVPFAAVGVIVARRQPRNPMGWLLAGVAVLALLSNAASLYALLDYRLGHRLPFGPVALLLDVCWEPAFMLLPLAILLFPDGRLPSARWRWVPAAYLAVSAVYLAMLLVVAVGTIAGHRIVVDANGGLVAVDYQRGWLAAAQHVILPVYVAFWLSFVARQVQAWRGAAGDGHRERRQQLKWLASGAAVSMVAILYDVVGPAFDPGAPALAQAAGVVIGLFIAALPVGIGVGILKYRLYEIDRIISRTLAYAIVTGLLVGVYAGLVLLATQVLTVTSPVAVAGSTLAAVALFSPLRRRVQRLVDRRFNRARYDADRMVTAFAARLQDAVDLEAVHADLTATVHRALEPEHLSVWTSS